jgi:pyruvate dehydrogenase E2 component (dihydrolipoamide acetyltransferase)
VRELAAKVRNGSLEPEYMTGGSFTVTNLGMYPVDEFCAIINPPQAGIVAVGRMKKALVVEPDDTMRVRTLCTVMGSFDHRIVNGTAGAAFLEHIKTILEDFKSV